jgi:prepilin peptidase CpaA
MSPQDLLSVCLFAFLALVLVAAAKDLTSYTIPNWISLALLAAFAPAAGAAWAAGAPLPELALCIGVGAGALLVGVIMFTLGWVGGGDAKLFAASALWLGSSALAPFLFWTAIGGGVLSMALMIGRRRSAQPAGGGWASALLTPGAPVPYGLAICAGALAALPHSMLAQLAF